ncbi:hypothetical protein [Agathobaculum sp. Marseille-P7918]|uniref:hypothetical protein n=1 Tax=Agathobaculum sp. Marseille-P7918 TaxID=2479843 RepID=UPI003563B58E
MKKYAEAALAAPAFGKSIKKREKNVAYLHFYHSVVTSNPEQKKIKFVQKNRTRAGSR